ncbi:MAG: hypothetical protein ACI8YQ_003033 [Polaribacter sp.]|jgi:hypothetical protein
MAGYTRNSAAKNILIGKVKILVGARKELWLQQ